MTDLPLSLLRTFVIVADTLNLTAAAKQLHRSPSTISMQLNRLETRVATTLLERGRYGVKLTAAGEQLHEHAQRLLCLNDRILADFRNASVKGRVRLGTHEHCVTASFSQLLEAYTFAYPGVKLDVICDYRAQHLVALIDAGKLDIALVDMPFSSAQGLSLAQEPLVWARAQRHPLRPGVPLPLVLSPAGCVDRELALSLLTQARVAHRIAFTSHCRSSLLAAVRAGIGIGVMPESVLEPGMVVIGEGLPKLSQIETRLVVAEPMNEATARLAVTITERALRSQ